MRKIIGIIFIVGLLGSGLLWDKRVRILEFARNIKKEQIPVAVRFEDVAAAPEGKTKKSEDKRPKQEDGLKTSASSSKAAAVPKPELPATLNLAVPFTAQAPHGKWSQPYQDACEEASAAMVHYFYSKKGFTPDVADREILDLVAFEQRTFGFDRDTTAEQTAEFIKNYYGYKKVEVLYEPAIGLIKEYLAKGLPVIVPVYGRALGNPYFTAPGPIYHMLVIKGYTKDKFITNDPGTRRGADYLYPFDVLMNAIHDWNGGDVQNGKKVMIVVHPN